MPVRLVNVLPQKVYGSVPLTLPLVRMSEAEAIQLRHDPQIYDANYPLDHSGLRIDPPWYANTGLGYEGQVNAGNVALLPHEMGMGYLGASAAAQAAAAKRAAAQAAQKAAAAQKKATAQAAQNQKHADAKAKQDAAKAAALQKRNDAQTNRATAKQQHQDAAAAKKQTAIDRKTSAQAIRDCRKSGGLWDAAGGFCSTPVGTPPTAPPIDPVTGQPVPIDPNTGQPYVPVGTPSFPTGPGTGCAYFATSCPPGMQPGIDANGCQTRNCVPGYQQPYIPQTGSPYGIPPGTSPIPPGYGDPSAGYGYGSGGGGGSPMMSSGGGPGPQMNDQANTHSEAPEEAAAETTDEGDKTEDSDTSKVAESNIFESIAKLFGMNGLTEGLNAPPPWIGMGGGNVPTPQQFVRAQPTAPVSSSVTSGVVAASVVGLAAAAALFIWSKKK